VRRFFAFGVAVLLACLPQIQERCPLITEPRPPPALPHDLAVVDALLLRRATEMVDASRGLHRFQVWWFRVGFAEQFLPDLCGRLERARELAVAGRIAEAGRKYQSLLVASQVMQLAIAMHAVAQGAEVAGQPGGEITQTLESFAAQMSPILEAALSEDPRRIEDAIRAHPDVFKAWNGYLTQWTSRLSDGAEKVKVAKLVWDTAFLVVATYEAAGAAAEIAASGGPPVAALPAFGLGDEVAAAGFSATASIELAEAIRRLVATGTLDAAVVALLSRTLGSGNAGGAIRPVASNGWGDPGTLQRHFRDHGADFGAQTPEGYAEQATEFLRRSRVERLPTKIEADGVIRVYEPKTNTFGAYNADGTTRTFFKPTSPAYFERQPGISPWPEEGG
jgi:hypothetical protein